MPFDAERKMMTVIVKDENRRYYMFSKGADSILMPRLLIN